MSDKRTNKRLKSHHQPSLTSFFAPKEAASATAAAESEPTAAISTTEASSDTASTAKEDAKGAAAAVSLDPIIPSKVPNERSVSWNSYNDAIIYRRPLKGNTTTRPKVAAFDMDGTLLVWRSATWPSRLEDYELWNPLVIAKLQDLYDTQGYQLLIITNQGGIRKAHSGKRAARVQSLVEWLAHMIQRPLSVIMSTDKKAGYHKPSVLIWKKAQQLLGSKDTPWKLNESFFVGDSVGGDDDPQGGTDIGLAANVSAEYGETLRFHTPTDYFGPSSATRRSKGSGQEAPNIPSHAQQARAELCSGVVWNSSAPLVILLCGAQGSGKSTFAYNLKKESSGSTISIFSQDTIRNGKAGTRQQVEAAVREALRKQGAGAIIIDRMHLDATQREIFTSLLQDESVDTTQQLHVIVFDPPVSVLAQRVRERTNHIVMGDKGAELARKSARSLTYPTYDEGFGLLSTVKGPASADRLLQRYTRILRRKEQETDISTAAISALPEVFPLQQCIQHPNNHPPPASAQPLQELPAIVLGTMKMGRRTATATIQLAMTVGRIAGVDCAPTYNNEDLVGPALGKDGVICITKVPKRASTAEEVQSELDTSLSKLQRSSVDLLFLHWPTESAKLEEIWRTMEQLLRDGKTRALGVCNFNVAALNDLLSFCVIPPVVVQIERHPMLPQWEIVDFCAQRDIQLQGHTPMGQGKDELFQAVQPIASRYKDHTVAQVLLAWNIQQGIAVVPKCSTQDHLEQLHSLPVLASEDLVALNLLGKESMTRFVSPPFMYGSGAFCWGKHFRR